MYRYSDTEYFVFRLEGFDLCTNSSDVQLLEQSDAGYHLYITEYDKRAWLSTL